MNYTNYGIIAALLVVVIFVFLLTRLDDNKGAISRAESKAADLAQVSTGTADDQLSTVNWSSGPFHSTMSLEEARVVVPFHILTPMYLPDGYELWEDVIVHDAPRMRNDSERLFSSSSGTFRKTVRRIHQSFPYLRNLVQRII